MIAWVRGTVGDMGPTSVVVDVAGVGYLLSVPTSMLSSMKMGAEVTIITQLVVREDSMTLYGFASAEQREAFRSLTGVTGVGPKLALSVLSSMDVSSMKKAVMSGDVDAFTAIAGIGKRGAQRMILELKEKLGVSADLAPIGSKIAQVREALAGLGYTSTELREILERLDEDSLEVEDMVKVALKELARV
ncbi:MAG: Holliday junction branch migration protein RuvA [Actinomycetota bacterium]